MKIILGSGSKYRRLILESMGFDFEVLVSHIDEKSIRSDDPHLLPLLIAKAKSEAIQKQMKEPAVLVTSDTVVFYNGQIREKPENEEQAKEYLRTYATKPAEVITAVFVVNTKTGKSAHGFDKASVYFHAIPEHVIHDLVKVGNVMYAAGGFIAEDPAIRKYVTHVEGNMDTVMGLPKILTKQLIDQVYEQ